MYTIPYLKLATEFWKFVLLASVLLMDLKTLFALTLLFRDVEMVFVILVTGVLLLLLLITWLALKYMKLV